MSGALDFGVEGNPNSARYGRYFWHATLADGRLLTLHADRAEVNAAGALQFWQDSQRNPAGGWEPKERPLVTLALAPGQWVHAYAASATDGHPACIDSLDEPKKPAAAGP
ncbi:MAG: hypothetical protein WCA46_29005 [Actinocatenispora sp.]